MPTSGSPLAVILPGRDCVDHSGLCRGLSGKGHQGQLLSGQARAHAGRHMDRQRLWAALVMAGLGLHPYMVLGDQFQRPLAHLWTTINAQIQAGS